MADIEDASVVGASSRPRLSSHLRLRFDRTRGQHVLLGPESVTVLNDTGAAIIGRCDGERTVAEIVEALRENYQDVAGGEVAEFLARLANKRCVEFSGDGKDASITASEVSEKRSDPGIDHGDLDE